MIDTQAQLKHGLLLDLDALAQEVPGEDLKPGGHTARTLVRGDDLRIVLISLTQGARIHEHQASGTTSIQVVRGQVRIGLADRTEALVPGQVLVLAPELRHSVEADEDSALLLNIAWHGSSS